MSRRVLLMMIFVACGEGGPVLLDGAASDARDPWDECSCRSWWCTLCNPFSPPGQQGCSVDQVCGFSTPTSHPEQHCVACVPDDGGLALGDPCTQVPGPDVCAPGLACDRGRCLEPCRAGEQPCTLGYCPTQVLGESVAICVPPCDPLAPACAPGEACYLSWDWTIETPGCEPEGTRPPGATCFGANDCVGGAACRDGTCRTYCDPALGLAACAAGGCVTPRPGASYGLCLP